MRDIFSIFIPFAFKWHVVVVALAISVNLSAGTTVEAEPSGVNFSLASSGQMGFELPNGGAGLRGAQRSGASLSPLLCD